MREVMQGYLCAGTLAPLEDNRSIATVKCPLDGSIHSRSAFDGQLCKTCELCTLGQDSLGLSILLTAGAPPTEPSASAASVTTAAATSMINTGATDPLAAAFDSAAAGTELFL